MAEQRRILVVDDEADSLEYVKAVLEPEGFSIITATNGQEGIEKAIAENPNLIILDVQMPVKDGFHAFYEIKHNEKIKNIPVVMLTGIRDKTDIGFSAAEMQEFMNVRPEGYLEKPMDSEKLKEMIKNILSRRQSD